MTEKPIPIASLKPGEVPEELQVKTYFDFRANPFAHEALFTRPETNSVIAVIAGIESYARSWLKENIARLASEAADKSPQATRPGENVCPTVDKNVCTTMASGDPALSGVLTAGRFEVVLEKGAFFKPAAIWGAVDAHKPQFRIYLSRGARVFGANIYLDEGDIFVGENTVIEPGVGIKGPTIIGKANEIRQGTYFRGSCITGDGCTLRGEIKNSVLLDKANFPHPSYLGDSICGYMSHFGNQATAANLGVFEGIRERHERKNIVLAIGSKAYDLGRSKVGIILGDYSQVGCNSVSDPATFLRPYTLVYSLTRLAKGFYGPNEIVKNKPQEKGVVERVPFRR